MNSQREDLRVDPVRLCLVAAMEKRAAAHAGETRRLLDARVAALRAACRDTGTAANAAPDAVDLPSKQLPGPLSELVAHIAVQTALRTAAPSRDAGMPASSPVATTGPESLAYFRDTWSRLSAERRLKRSLATVPGNAGPLNSHHLTHRTLALMRALSPGYLTHFMTYADALLWVDQASGGAKVTAGKEAAQPETARKTRRAKAG